MDNYFLLNIVYDMVAVDDESLITGIYFEIIECLSDLYDKEENF